MTTQMTTQQIANYHSHGVVHPDHPSYQEATKLKAVARSPYFSYRKDETERKMNALFKEAISSYLEQAKAASTPDQQAFFYANARTILGSERPYADRELKEQMVLNECEACLNAAEKASSPTDRAAWYYLAAMQLMSYPVINPYGENPKKYELAAKAYENLGDLFKEYKKEIKIRISFLEALPYDKTYSIRVDYHERPKYVAALCYANAAYAQNNVDYLKYFDKVIRRTDAIPLIDKAIEAMQSVGLKINDVWFNAQCHEILGYLHSLKLYLQPDDALKSETFRLRMEAARQFEVIARDDVPGMYFHAAKNLRVAADCASSEKEKLELKDKAAQFAIKFLESRNIDIANTQFYQSSLMKVEQEAYQIIWSSSVREIP